MLPLVLSSDSLRPDRQDLTTMRKISLFFFVFLIILLQPVSGEQTGIIETNEVIVLFEESLGPAAKEVADICPGLKGELEETLEWRLNFRPKVLLIKDRQKFQEMAGSNLFVAYALPQKRLVVIDYSRMNTGPFTLRTTLKHELCHLLLHHYIQRGNLPRWLDEGISQWVSDGMSEIIMDTKRSVLKGATLTGNYITMDQLAEGFPQDKKSLLLAYEESKSFVEYINSEFGREAVLNILKQLKNGREVELAVLKALSIPLDELERRWQSHLRKRTTWLTFLATHLYGILFFLAALITIWGFIRVLIKKRRYEDEEDDASLD